MKLPAVALALSLALLGAPAAAQDEAANGTVSDAQIEVFVDVAIEVQRIQEKAQADILAVLEAAEGITFQEYHALLQRMQSEPELRDRIRTRAQQKTGGQ